MVSPCNQPLCCCAQVPAGSEAARVLGSSMPPIACVLDGLHVVGDRRQENETRESHRHGNQTRRYILSWAEHSMALGFVFPYPCSPASTPPGTLCSVQCVVVCLFCLFATLYQDTHIDAARQPFISICVELFNTALSGTSNRWLYWRHNHNYNRCGSLVVISTLLPTVRFLIISYFRYLIRLAPTGRDYEGAII